MTPSLPRFRSHNPVIGDRVVARRRIPGANVHWTDVIGHVIGVDPLVIRPQSIGGMPSDAEEIMIPDEQLEVIKILSPRTIRNSDIRAVEVATAKAFPGLVNEWHDGWLLRAGDGIAERSNSASPLGPGVGFEAVPMEAITQFYATHDLPIKLHIPERIGRPAQKLVDAAPRRWALGPEILVMTKSLELQKAHEMPQGLAFSVDKQPDREWLDMYHFRGQALPEHALELLRTQIDGHMGFGRLTTPGGQTVAITRATITAAEERTFLGYSAVEVAPAYRRQGLGTALGSLIQGWGAEQGAKEAYLQVVAHNKAGIGLYQKLGFSEHHRHRYAEQKF
ncbi:N-acetylglutamate synthase, CG3035 family [Corynebacterium crudilactis]|uniref:Acetyltransferase n=1 Tax=Corynebacterium crudilactis TaxID=1652495 RepID=A0A172QW23_9CORY|nr:GNAT family N-acetyltransferase [Corynebacterium crudilactis]ANE04914.1 acetyltransferase [Corynebacterium crudilactis]